MEILSNYMPLNSTCTFERSKVMVTSSRYRCPSVCAFRLITHERNEVESSNSLYRLFTAASATHNTILGSKGQRSRSSGFIKLSPGRTCAITGCNVISTNCYMPRSYTDLVTLTFVQVMAQNLHKGQGYQVGISYTNALR